MVGDDVVDLADADALPGALHPRWDARVFSPAEREALASADAPPGLRWALWAAKEAALKLARKRAPGTPFSPRRFEVRLDARLRGRVAWPGGEARVAVIEAEGALHALAWDARAEEARLLHACARGADADPRALSDGARRLASREAESRLGVCAGSLRVEKRGRVPRLVHARGGAFDLSLSHHGRVVAFACDPLERSA